MRSSRRRIQAPSLYGLFLFCSVRVESPTALLYVAGQFGLELAKTGSQKDLIEKNKNNDRHNVIVFGVTKLHWHQNHH